MQFISNYFKLLCKVESFFFFFLLTGHIEIFLFTFVFNLVFQNQS